MNYIKLINQIWDLREQGLITSHEYDLYSYLVHRSNRLGWKNPFSQSTDVLCAVLGINRNSLSRRRRRLCEMGLIRYKEGETKTRPAEYELCQVGNVRAKRSAAKKQPKPAERKVNPTRDEVIAFCKERKSVVDALTFFNFYEAKQWTISGREIADWRAVLMKWENRRVATVQKNNFAKYSKSISDVEF